MIFLGFISFIFEVCDHFFNIINRVIKTVNIFQLFFQFLFQIIILTLSSGADGYNFNVSVAIYQIKT